MKTPVDNIVDYIKSEMDSSNDKQVLNDVLAFCLGQIRNETSAIADAYTKGRQDGFVSGNYFEQGTPEYENAKHYYYATFDKHYDIRMNKLANIVKGLYPERNHHNKW